MSNNKDANDDIIDFIIKHLDNPTFIINEYYQNKNNDEIKNFTMNLIEKLYKKFNNHFILLKCNNKKIICIIYTQIYNIKLIKYDNSYRWSLKIL